MAAVEACPDPFLFYSSPAFVEPEAFSLKVHRQFSWWLDLLNFAGNASGAIMATRMKKRTFLHQGRRPFLSCIIEEWLLLIRFWLLIFVGALPQK